MACGLSQAVWEIEGMFKVGNFRRRSINQAGHGDHRSFDGGLHFRMTLMRRFASGIDMLSAVAEAWHTVTEWLAPENW
jgi:hypothetical protein